MIIHPDRDELAAFVHSAAMGYSIDRATESERAATYQCIDWIAERYDAVNRAP